MITITITITIIIATKVANLLKKKNPDLYQYPIVTYRYNETTTNPTTKISNNITLETRKALTILKGLSIQQQDHTNTNTNDIITKTITIFKELYLKSPDKFISHLLNSTTSNTSNTNSNTNANTNNSSKILTKNCIMSESEMIRVLLKLCPNVPRLHIKKVFDLFQEQCIHGERMVNVSVFIALLRMSIKKDNDHKKSLDDVSLHFWTKENLRGSPIKAGRATGSLTKGSRWASVGGNSNTDSNDDSNINEIAPFLKYWHEIEADEKQKHTNHMNFERDPSIHSNSSIEILRQGQTVDIIPSRVPGTLTKRELIVEDVDMDNILKESNPVKNTKSEVKKRVGFHVDAYGKSTKSMLAASNTGNEENDDKIIFLSPQHPKSPTKKSSSDFIRSREESGICRKANCTCGSHAISTLTEGAGLPRYDPLNIQSTKVLTCTLSSLPSLP